MKDKEPVDISVFSLKKAIDSLPSIEAMRYELRCGNTRSMIQKRVLLQEINVFKRDPQDTCRVIELTFEWQREEWVLKNTTL